MSVIVGFIIKSDTTRSGTIFTDNLCNSNYWPQDDVQSRNKLDLFVLVNAR